jgi:hypothetical protein
MDPQLETRLHELETKIEAIWQSVEKTRRYFQITMWASVILFILPLFFAAFAIPTAMSSYMEAINAGGLQDLQGL